MVNSNIDLRIRKSFYPDQAKGGGLKAQEMELINHGASKIYKDTYTGAKMDRPQLDKLLKVIKEGDTFMVARLDRIARSVKEGIDFFDMLNARGVKVYVLDIGVIDDTPMGKFIRNIFLSFAEFERAMIRQRTMEGKELARKKPGFTEGRPRLKVEGDIKELKKLVDKGDKTVTEACKELGISRKTWYNKLKAM